MTLLGVYHNPFTLAYFNFYDTTRMCMMTTSLPYLMIYFYVTKTILYMVNMQLCCVSKYIKESEYKYQIIECYWSLWIKIKSIRVKNLNNMLKKKCNICLENGRTQSNMCLKSVREIIF